MSMEAMKFAHHPRNRLATCLIARGGGLLLLAWMIIAAPVLSGQPAHPALIKAEFVFERSAFPANHGSTIVQTREGLLAAWFSGPEPRHPEVSIWSARYNGTNWSAPVEEVKGTGEDGRRYQCWNPVLFQPANGPLLLFYKVGPSPEKWWGMSMTSTNEGKNWSKAARLPEGFVGPVRNKPIELPDGSLLCGASSEAGNWTIHMERRFPRGERWEKSSILNQPAQWAAIQPTILRHDSRTIQILCRTKQQGIVECWSGDGGRTWGPVTATSLPNPNSAIDAVRLDDGRFLLVYNHSATERNVLNIALSKDGKNWKPAVVLENQAGEFSYPAVVQSSDRLVHITYSWNRQRIKHAALNPAKLE